MTANAEHPMPPSDVEVDPRLPIPPGWETYTFVDDIGCVREAANLRRTHTHATPAEARRITAEDSRPAVVAFAEQWTAFVGDGWRGGPALDEWHRDVPAPNASGMRFGDDFKAWLDVQFQAAARGERTLR